MASRGTRHRDRRSDGGFWGRTEGLFRRPETVVEIIVERRCYSGYSLTACVLFWPRLSLRPRTAAERESHQPQKSTVSTGTPSEEERRYDGAPCRFSGYRMQLRAFNELSRLVSRDLRCHTPGATKSRHRPVNRNSAASVRCAPWNVHPLPTRFRELAFHLLFPNPLYRSTVRFPSLPDLLRWTRPSFYVYYIIKLFVCILFLSHCLNSSNYNLLRRFYAGACIFRVLEERLRSVGAYRTCNALTCTPLGAHRQNACVGVRDS